MGLSMYYGDSFADKATMRLEGKIKRIYAQAYDEIEGKLNKFLAGSVKREKAYKAKVQEGTMTQAEFDRWKSGQVFIGKRWRDLRQNISEELYHSRKSATDMINDERKTVFQNNVNYAMYDIDKSFKYGISFTLYDDATVTRLIKEEPTLLPDLKYPDPNIDYAWSKKQIASAITQGVLQGESIPELAKRIGLKLSSSNEKSMVRCARTAMTGAQNSGRIQAMHDAMDMGIKVQKLWIATLDRRTRDAHRNLDGQIRDVDKPFDSDLGPIMFPADPDAKPANTWNCFVGDTKVASDSEIIRSYKHDYSGELFTFKTASGIEFTCTPNHPILTNRGWIRAKFLNNGDSLANASGIKYDFLGIDPNVNHTFPCFDTIHEFFKKVGVKRTCRLGVNFHGDIPTSDVEIISKKRFLRKNWNSGKPESKNKLGFKTACSFILSKGHFMSCFRRIYISFFSLMSGIRKAFSFFWRSVSHSCVHGFRTISDVDTTIAESQSNNISSNTEFIGNCLDGFSGRIFFDDIVDIQISSVTHIPVYNLQTKNGYYFVSNNASLDENTGKVNGNFIIAHNCRCSLGWEYPDYKNQYDTRAAREVDWEEWGQTEQVPYMTYNEWKKWKTDQGHTVSNERNNAEEQAKAKRNEIINHIKSSFDNIPEKYRDIIFKSIDNADDTMLSIVDRTVDNVTVGFEEYDPHGVSHYGTGTGSFVVLTKDSDGDDRNESDILRTFWHEYGHFVDDAYVSKSGYGRQLEDGYTLNGIRAIIKDERKWELATQKDVNLFLKKMGLDKTYECVYEDGMYCAMVYKNGKYIDPKNLDYETMSDLSDALTRWSREFASEVGMDEYMIKKYNYPVRPDRDQYIESYYTPKRNLYREREVFKGARDAYQAEIEKYYTELDNFAKKHDVEAIREEWYKLALESEKKKKAVGAATDTFDGGVMGVFSAHIFTGGHTPEYLSKNTKGCDEGIANVFSNQMTNNEYEREAMMSLCPNLYELIRGAIRND